MKKIGNCKLYLGDCLDKLNYIKKNSINLVICDLPYGVTNNRWDSVIPFGKMWKLLDSVCKNNCAILLFSDGMFCAELMMSNKKNWRYNLIWNKILPSGFLNANKMPLRNHEEICVFYKKLPKYNPQKSLGLKTHSRGTNKKQLNRNYSDFDFADNADKHGNKKFPISILTFQKPHPSICVHPTQKPTELLEYLIKTYSDEGDRVLDFTMGSGSTGVACQNLNRKFIGIEKDKKYFKIACKRIKKASSSLFA